MGIGKFLMCVAGGVVAIAAAPLVLPIAAAVGTTALAAGGAVAAAGGAVATAAGGAAVAAGGSALAAVGSTAVGGAVIGATSAVGSAVAAGGAAVGGMAMGAATATGSAIAGSAVGSSVIGAATTVGGMATGAMGTVSAIGSSAIGGVTAVTGITQGALLSGAVAGTIGAGGTYTGLTLKEGFDSLKEAKALMAEAERIDDVAKSHFERVAEVTASRLEALLVRRAEVYATSIGPSIAIIRNFQEVNETNLSGEDSRALLDTLSPEELEKADQTTSNALRIIEESKKGISVMHGAMVGTLAFVSQFGIASTGTAISSLSGAAATNATLAALGGGTIAAGGGGIALGAAVLGGVVILPASITAAYRFATDAEKKLTAAHMHYAKIVESAGRYRTAETALRAVNRRVRELKYAMTRLSDLYMHSVYPRLEAVYASNRRDDGRVHCPELSDEDRLSMRLTLQMLRSLKQIVGAPVLDGQGFPSTESSRAIATAMSQTSTVSA